MLPAEDLIYQPDTAPRERIKMLGFFLDGRTNNLLCTISTGLDPVFCQDTDGKPDDIKWNQDTHLPFWASPIIN